MYVSELLFSNLFGVIFVTLKLLVPLIAGIMIVQRGRQESNSLVWAIGMATIAIGVALAFS